MPAGWIQWDGSSRMMSAGQIQQDDDAAGRMDPAG